MTGPRWWKIRALRPHSLLSILERLAGRLQFFRKAEPVKTIFTKARSLQGSKRERYLKKACRNDDAKRLKVERLLAHDKPDQVHSWLQIFSLPSEPPKFKAGNLIGDYQIIDLLGRGGMGEVYVAHDYPLNRKVALKFLPQEMARDQAFIDRLQREARAASSLKHPNIVTVHALGEHQGQRYIVSEHVEGKSLRELIGNLAVEQAINFARQIGIALEFAHSRGIIHRDIKPENIMVTPEGQIKVLDFGLAKKVGLEKEPQSQGAGVAGTDALTNPRVGTPAYMSPEQLDGDELDRRTDIWSWGIVLYEMLTGERPSLEDVSSDDKVLAAARCSNRLKRVVMKALSKKREKRYTDMKAAVAELDKAKSPFTTGRIAVAASVVILTAIGVYLISSISRPAPPLPSVKIERVVPLKTKGDITHVAMSPKEESFVYSTEEAGRQSLRRHWFITSADEEIHSIPSGSYSGVTFSRDGKSIFYTSEQDKKGNVYELRLGTTESTLILEDVDSPVSPSLDGNSLAFMRAIKGNNHTSLYIQNIRNSDNEKPIYISSTEPPEFFYRFPAWSPNGDKVLYGTWGTGQKMVIVDIRSTKRAVRQVDFYQKGKAAWMGEGRGIVVVGAIGASEHWILQTPPPQYRWRITEFITRWLNLKVDADKSSILRRDYDYRELDMVPRSQKIVAVQTERKVAPWVATFKDDALDKLQRVPLSPDRFNGMGWLKSGKLLTLLNKIDEQQLLSIDVNTGDPEAHINNVYYDMYLTLSLDSDLLVYASNRDSDGTFRLWRTNLSNLSGQSERLTKGGTKTESQPVFSPDGKWVIYTALEEGIQKLWKVRIADGEHSRITDNPSRNAAISRDGRIACEYWEDNKWKTAILNLDTGQKIRTLPKDRPLLWPIWSRDGKYLIYVETDNYNVSNLWEQPVDGGQSIQITHFNQDQIFDLALSPDGLRLAFLRGATSSKVVLFELSK